MGLNLNPILWGMKKYLQEFIVKEINPISDRTNSLEKENISLNHLVSSQKEIINKLDLKIISLEERLRQNEIKISSFKSAIEVVKMVNSSSRLLTSRNNSNFDSHE